MRPSEIKHQRDAAIKEAANGQIYVKQNGILDFIPAGDLIVNIDGKEIALDNYLKLFNQYKREMNSHITNLEKEMKELKETVTSRQAIIEEEYLRSTGMAMEEYIRLLVLGTL